MVGPEADLTFYHGRHHQEKAVVELARQIVLPAERVLARRGREDFGPQCFSFSVLFTGYNMFGSWRKDEIQSTTLSTRRALRQHVISISISNRRG